MDFSLKVKNLRSVSCIHLLRDKLKAEGFKVVAIQPGIIQISGRPSPKEQTRLVQLLTTFGFDPIEDKELLLVEQIKQAVHELIYEMNNVDSVVRKSEYLVEKLNRSYSTLSRIFSLHSAITLEKYIILQKIGRIRELIDDGELSLSEIAFMMDYNSVQYLSFQFKSVTGFSVSEYKQTPEILEPFLSELALAK
jgi:AraC-like DNA-binding protein